jgi:integrase/recombinase XerC
LKYLSQQHQEYLEQFVNYLQFEKGYSQLTTVAYRQDLHIVFTYIDDILLLNNTSIQNIVLQERAKGKSAKSIKRLTSSVSSFLQFLTTIEVLPTIHLDIQTPKLDKTLPKTLTYEQILLLLRNCVGKNQKRNQAIIAILYSCGLRVSELVGLNKQDVNIREKFIKVLGKGGKERYTPIGKNALQYLQQYLKETGSLEAIFLNTQHQRLTTRSVQAIVSKCGELAGIEFAITPHMLRHSSASHLLQSSGDLRSTQEYLGHKNITSTQVYTHLDFQHIADIYDENHPHGNEVLKGKNKDNTL